MNRRKVVYKGSLGAVRLADHSGNNYRFDQGKPREVPDEFASKIIDGVSFFDGEEPDRTVSERFSGPATITFRRWGALGDLVQFRAACAAYRRARPDHEVVLRCSSEFASFFAADTLWSGVAPIEIGVPAAGGYVTFDQTAEVDHDGVQIHRSELFLKAMTSTPIRIEAEDWFIPIPAEAEAFVDKWLENRGLTRAKRDCKLIAVQVRGSGLMKTLPIDQLKKIVARITAGKAQVVLIEHDERMVWTAEHVHAMTGRDALHAVHLLRQCDGLICMDSGALWLAHVAPVRTVCVLGPTKPEQRIAKHPYYPLGARAIELNKTVVLNGKVGCEACFEQAAACERKFSCIRDQPDEIVVEAVLEALSQVLDGRMPLATAS